MTEKYYGKYRGTVIMQEEQDAGLAFMKSLTPEQRTAATLKGSRGPATRFTWPPSRAARSTRAPS